MTAPTPRLSVLIASHNRRQMLRRCLAALEAQSQDPADFEVIVADDGSNDDTTVMMEALQTPLDTRVLRFEKAGKPVVLNAAIEAARGSVCLFIDDDVIASPQLVAAHLAAHERDPRTLGIGALTQPPPRGRDWYARAFAMAWNERYEELEHRPAHWTDCYGANFSVARAALEEIGGFATDLGTIEDFDIAYRLHLAGALAVYLPDAGAIHDDHKSRERLLADLRREGRAYVEFAGGHPAATGELLDWTGSAGPVELRLRRLLIALRVPPAPVAALGALVPGRGRKMIWLHFVRRLVFWGAARGAMSAGQWARLTHSEAERRAAP